MRASSVVAAALSFGVILAPLASADGETQDSEDPSASGGLRAPDVESEPEGPQDARLVDANASTAMDVHNVIVFPSLDLVINESSSQDDESEEVQSSSAGEAAPPSTDPESVAASIVREIEQSIAQIVPHLPIYGLNARPINEVKQQIPPPNASVETDPFITVPVGSTAPNWSPELPSGSAEAAGHNWQPLGTIGEPRATNPRPRAVGPPLPPQPASKPVVEPSQSVPFWIPLSLGVAFTAGASLNEPVLRQARRAVAAFPLFSRLVRSEVLENTRRRLILEYAVENPGESIEVARKSLEIHQGAMAYHVRVLERHGLLVKRTQGQRKLLYPREHVGTRMSADAPYVSAYRREILRLLETKSGISQRELAQRLGTSDRNVSYHLSWLKNHGVVDTVRNGKSKECRLPCVLPP